jgi:Na+-driven multidrug efflux pump
MLTGAGDTKFIMKVGVIAPWIFLVLPVYYEVNYLGWKVDWINLSFFIYGTVLLLVYFWRFKSNKWRKIHIVEE